MNETTRPPSTLSGEAPGTNAGQCESPLDGLLDWFMNASVPVVFAALTQDSDGSLLANVRLVIMGLQKARHAEHMNFLNAEARRAEAEKALAFDRALRLLMLPLPAAELLSVVKKLRRAIDALDIDPVDADFWSIIEQADIVIARAEGLIRPVTQPPPPPQTAATDMLAALKQTLDYWTSTGFAECEPDCDCIVESVRAAILKAEPRPALDEAK